MCRIYKFLVFLLVQIKWLFGYPTYKLSNSEINYDEYWKEKRGSKLGELSSFQKTRADNILPFLSDGDIVIDVGCGDGAILDYLRKNVNIKAIGLDKSNTSLEIVKSRGIDTILSDLNDEAALENIPTVDYMMALEVLEHMPDPENFLDKLDFKIKKGFIISFPNTGYWMHRFRLLFGSFPLQWRVHPGEHLRFWTIRDAKWWFNALQRNVISTIPYEGIPLLNKLWPGMFAMGLIFIVSPKDKKVN